MKVPNMSEIRRTAREWGDKFFEPGTMKFFRCKVGNKVYQGPGGTFFVTRETPSNGGYIYTVRQVSYIDREIITAGGFRNFGRFRDWGPAYKAAKKCAQWGIEEGLPNELEEAEPAA